MKQPLKDLLAWCESKGIKVTFTKDVRDLHDYSAMNPAAAKIMGYKRIKRDEYKVDATLPEDTQFKNLVHELVEDEVIEDGSPYWPAHLFSLKAEKWPISKVKAFVNRRRGKPPIRRATITISRSK